jgi:hypothetical protein
VRLSSLEALVTDFRLGSVDSAEQRQAMVTEALKELTRGNWTSDIQTMSGPEKVAEALKRVSFR